MSDAWAETVRPPPTAVPRASEISPPPPLLGMLLNFSWPTLHLILIHTIKIMDHCKYLVFPFGVLFSSQIFSLKGC